MEFVLNKDYGGFSLSRLAMVKLGSDSPYDYVSYTKRNDSKLIEVVKSLGKDANGHFASLRIVSIPDSATDYYIEDYDGIERVTYVVDGKLQFA